MNSPPCRRVDKSSVEKLADVVRRTAKYIVRPASTGKENLTKRRQQARVLRRDETQQFLRACKIHRYINSVYGGFVLA